MFKLKPLGDLIPVISILLVYRNRMLGFRNTNNLTPLNPDKPDTLINPDKP